jgi:threonine dehydrogenase-like Zn-dependent dehydrogenase
VRYYCYDFFCAEYLIMQAIWLESQQLSLRHDLPMPQPQAGEALVKVLRAGICNTDLELWRGYYPYVGVLGHEFVGVVAAVADSAAQDWVGQRVVGEINAACGGCEFCDRGIPTHCLNRSVLGIVNRNGAFADYLTLPIANLHAVPESVSTDAATFVEPLAAALQIQTQVTVTPDLRVLVVGDGKLGQLVAQTLALTGCELWAIGRHGEKLAHLADRGIRTGFEADVVGRSFDLAVECTGNPAGFALALSALRSRGTLVLKSTYAGQLALDASAIVVEEITVVGSRCGAFGPAIELLAAGRVNVDYLIQGRYGLGDGLAAFDRAMQRGTMKILLEP